MDSIKAFLEANHVIMDVCVVTCVMAALHRNYLHKAATIGAGCFALSKICAPTATMYALFALVAYFVPPFFSPVFKKQPETGAVFVTGADSGMGEATVLHLCRASGYERVYAGCFAPESEAKLRKQLSTQQAVKLRAVPLNVCDDASVANAAKEVEKDLRGPGKAAKGLIAVVQCAGMGYNGPGEFIPIDIYKKQMDVNFFGYVRVAQALMPLVRLGCKVTKRRGRMIFTGTGGGVLTPVPPLLTAYMASKFAVEAFVRSFRVEMQLTEKPIDACIISPGFVKPTMLVENGLRLNEAMWAQCQTRLGTSQARDEYGPLLDRFIEYSLNEKGTHVSEGRDRKSVV